VKRSGFPAERLIPVPPAGDRATGSAQEMEHQADDQQDYANHQQYVGEEKSEDGEDNSKCNHVFSFTLGGRGQLIALNWVAVDAAGGNPLLSG
jgi:hypothetical protein